MKAAIIFVFFLMCARGDEEKRELCLPWFDEIMGRCYYFSGAGEEMTWHGARDQCSAYGGELATLGRTCDEDVEILKAIAAKSVSQTWIGASDLAEVGLFRWVDGRDIDNSYQGWYPAYPSSTPLRDCVYLQKYTPHDRMYMKNIQCETQYPFICEVPIA